MLKSIFAATLLTTMLASGAMAAAPSAVTPVLKKAPVTLVQKASMKKVHCKKGMHMSHGKCVVTLKKK